MNGGSRKTSYLNHFASADTIVPDPQNPQAYNRYSYVYNNPIRFNDPSGHCGEDVLSHLPSDDADGCATPAPSNLISREEWGAREPGNNWLCGNYEVCQEWENLEGDYHATHNPNGYASYNQLSPDVTLADVYHQIVIHHGGNGMSVITLPLAIQVKHQTERGWHDIAYHYLIDSEGNIYEGRDIRYRGAHVSGANTGRIGILLIGDFEPGMELLGFSVVDLNGDSGPPTLMMQAAAMELTIWLDNEFGIDSVVGHQHHNNTECPGSLCIPLVSSLNALVQPVNPD